MGFICDWKTVTISNPTQNKLTKLFQENGPLSIPINHGEGRFVIKDTLLNKLDSITLITYSTPDGASVDTYPTNPNGSTLNLAGIGNKKGNILAMMPHPERACFSKQIPRYVRGVKSKTPSESTPFGPWFPLFSAMKQAVIAQKVVHS